MYGPWLIGMCIIFLGSLIGTIGEMVAGKWAAAVLGAIPTGIFLALVILFAIACAREAA